jgi:rhodanese-related sulfurtransferase
MHSKDKKLRITRRRLILGGLGLTAAGSIAWSQATKLPFEGDAIDPKEAHNYAVTGELTLLDIRRPDEWAATGSGEGAHRLDMRRKDFIEALDVILEGDRTKPVALICARGVRSNWTSQKLKDAGFTNIIDIPEGMLGSSVGPGWLKRKLPVQFY